MKFRYSTEVDASVYVTEGLGYGIPLRTHKDQAKEIEGTLRAQKDWSNHVDAVDGYHGGLGDPYSFMCVTVPECLPERLEVISYANEFAFLYDDGLERFDLKEGLGRTAGFLDTFGAGALDLKIDPGARPEKRLQAQLFSEMMAIDAKRAITSMKAWARFVQSAARTRSAPFETLDQYMPARAVDAGELIWFGTLTFGMALTIPDGEMDLCMEMARPAYIALGLVNDLYSWKKEEADAIRAGQDYVFNAIWVIMKERSVDEADAKDICREEAIKAIATYSRTVEEARRDASLSRDLRIYLHAVQLSYIGNVVWSIYCPRYREF
ncbi:Uu.00g116090.m01.CDS01 [Anthostomella pinea]|uniref:Uu.00g116090.m01.CDS01 n=1 Tax=Anthostomella pinea TaxID=933095 RepID=A0AAI8YGQ1_9PEZI|nr:Uu.00g116090.m01.CDS01 [Anthostomella pinea]